MKKLSVVVAGTGQIRDVEIQAGTTAGDILHQLNLTDYLLSTKPWHASAKLEFAGRSRIPAPMPARLRRATRMKATQEAVQAPAALGARRNEKVGQVVSTEMKKTIVVAVEMRKAHPKYKRIVRTTKKFYAHDEQSSARMGDVVRTARPVR